ncbi:MAG: hypothetical protein CUN49_01825 [Candidatus Thermofonsia Clade 1 bacterium]|jgi:membrane protease YdiL (CAAX protease family)|uniref:CAAX prenyl protease 2/Lysostaphin resistance protein A-like domain-containing protein n=1 Tax=Candidatus Thermofonsia Clade 1 bacterium TaxID=2364210 RepID=A0A2M8PHW4_9CHLR|nr:MAG: hypothetical protein CUN49_01825 [Candidatus Thermofonsia Clade 1 bacterium]
MLGVWLGALVYLALTGYPIFGLLLLAGIAVIGILVTLLLTEAPPRVGLVVIGAPYNRILSQIAVLMGVIVLTGLSSKAYVPLWSEALDVFRGMGRAYLSRLLASEAAESLSDFGALFVIPAVLLLLLGARWREFGLSSIGHRPLRVALLWCALPIAFILLALWARAVTLTAVWHSLLMQAFGAFGAEFLFRGALQSRLLRLTSLRWALLLQALSFALWHVPTLTVALSGNALAGAAYALAHYGTIGMALGVIAARTRSLWPGVALSVVLSALGLMHRP